MRTERLREVKYSYAEREKIYVNVLYRYIHDESVYIYEKELSDEDHSDDDDDDDCGWWMDGGGGKF